MIKFNHRYIYNVLLIALLSFLFYSIIVYFFPISYSTEYYAINLDREPKTLYKLELTLSTQSAFLPNEYINAEAKVELLDEVYKTIFQSEGGRIVFEDSYENENYDYSIETRELYLNEINVTEGSNVDSLIFSDIIITENCAKINLNRVFDSNGQMIYEGKARVLYKKPGSFRVLFQSSKNNVFPHETVKVEIASTVDYLNAKNNKLILAITILSIALSVMPTSKRK